jgi:pilus assembly protein Flp/PilA
MINSRPNVNKQERYAKIDLTYNNKTLLKAWGEMLNCVSKERSSYQYDIVNIGRQVLGNYFNDLWILYKGALKAKDYATVVTKYGEYLKQNNYQDTARIFNCGYAANQAKNYAEAAKYFDMAVKMNYNVDDSYVGEAMAYRNLNKTEEFLTTVKEGLKVIPDGNKNKTNLEKLLYGYCIKQGQAAQKKGDLAGAEKMYKEVLAVSNKDYQSNAYYSLGAMLYGNGAKILQAATPIATSEPDKYNAEKAKADKDFKQAKEYLTKAVELDPKDENSKKILASINDILK